jgi:hypothetical protein
VTIIRDPGSQIIFQYGVPLRGTWRSVAVHTVPVDALYDSLNVFLRKGKLRARPGLTLLNGTVFVGPILGGAMAVTPLDKRVVAFTPTACYELGEHDQQWVLTSSGAFAPTAEDTIDLAFMETAGNYVGLIANQAYPLQVWNGTAHSIGQITPATGSDRIPNAKSVCIAVRRVVALVPPHTLRWSRTFDITYWPPNAYNKVAQTNDLGICVRTLSNTSFALYKERSIYIARAREGNDDSAFTLSDPLRVEGPAGVKAVVDVSGLHVYMTKNGRIATFDGSSYPQWIADGLWLFLQDDIDPAYAHFIFGVYDYRLHSVTFYYARKQDRGQARGMVIICLPLEGQDVASQQPVPAVFRGVSTYAMTHGCEMRFQSSIDRSLLFAQDRRSFLSDEAIPLDQGQAYPCMFTHPLTAMPDAKHTKVSYETFVERSQGYGVLECRPLTSDGLETEDPLVPDGKVEYIDLETAPVQTVKAFNVQTRFFGLRYDWMSDSTVRYSGSVVYKANR